MLSTESRREGEIAEGKSNMNTLLTLLLSASPLKLFL
jgi:hypothetical protein